MFLDLFLRQATPLPDRLDRAALQVGWSDLGGMVRGEAGGPVPQGSTDYPAGGSESQAWGGSPGNTPCSWPLTNSPQSIYCLVSRTPPGWWGVGIRKLAPG